MTPASRIALALIGSLSATLAAAATPSAPAPEATIDRAGLSAATRFLSSDLLEGRGPGSRGDALARAYLATELEEAGLEPGGPDGGWDQRFEMVGMTAKAPEVWRFEKGGRAEDLAWWKDWIGASGRQAAKAEIAGAELVFVGYGIQAPEYSWDDYKGTDLRGKVLVMLNNDPDWDPALFAGKTRLYYGRWDYKYESAARQGAAGAILVHTDASASYPWKVVQTSWSGEQFDLPSTGEPELQLKSWVTEAAARRLAALGGRDLTELVEAAKRRDFRPMPLGVTTSLALDVAVRRVETGNVLGLLRGSDPALAGEVVVFTAHHDHLGIGQPDAEGDRIYNGALDNATGCAQILEVARAFAAMHTPPKRSLLFAFVAAEEQGLLGSEYYAQHPTFPPGKIAANINVDSANIYGKTSDISYIGYGKSSLDKVIEAAAAKQGRTVRPDPAPEKGSFYRSDQFNFARIGVPALYIDPGTDLVGPDAAAARQRQEAYDSTCYHQACDEIDDEWVWDGMIDDTKVVFACGLAIANSPTLPTWNPGDEFEAARKKALATTTRQQ